MYIYTSITFLNDIIIFQSKTNSSLFKIDPPTRRTEGSSNNHIERNIRARKVKEEQQSKVYWKGLKTSSKKIPSNLPFQGLKNENNNKDSSPDDDEELLDSDNWREQCDTDMLDVENIDVKEGRQIKYNGSNDRSTYSTTDNHYQQYNVESDEADDEKLIQMLERERREWYIERTKLVNCIQLQQVELNQRSLAAHDKAVDIAKDFARVIEGFEQRLLTVEENVHKELVSIRTIMEHLKNSNPTAN